MLVRRGTTRIVWRWRTRRGGTWRSGASTPRRCAQGAGPGPAGDTSVGEDRPARAGRVLAVDGATSRWVWRDLGQRRAREALGAPCPLRDGERAAAGWPRAG